MIVGSLFTGCMGLDLGLEAAGHTVAWACENDPTCHTVIAHHRPGLPIIADVREVSAGFGPVGLLAGGFPCQDLSYAGRGAGLDGDRSGQRRTYYQKVEGWERWRDQGGTNALALRRPFDEFICVECMTGILAGVRAGQGSLL